MATHRVLVTDKLAEEGSQPGADPGIEAFVGLIPSWPRGSGRPS